MQGGRAFWPVLTLVLLGHGAVLTLLTASAPPGAGSLAAPAPNVFQVRPLQPPQPPQPPADPPAPPAAVPAPAPPAETPVAAAPAPEPQPPAPLPAVAPAPPDPPYLPRSELTAAAQPLQAVDLPFPEEVKGLVDLKVQLTLFIDEQGVVQRVRIDTPDIAAPFEQAVRDTFSRARFKPAEVQGLPVRSQMRIEVEFSAPGAARR